MTQRTEQSPVTQQAPLPPLPDDAHAPIYDSTSYDPSSYDPGDDAAHDAGPRPIATLTLIAVLLLVTIAFWMMVLGVQQGRA